MGIRKINESTLTAIGNAIRSKTGGSALINPEDMATEIGSIQTGGGDSLLIAEGTFEVTSDDIADGKTVTHNLGVVPFYVEVEPVTVPSFSGQCILSACAFYLKAGTSVSYTFDGRTSNFAGIFGIGFWGRGGTLTAENYTNSNNNGNYISAFTSTTFRWRGGTSYPIYPGTYKWRAFAFKELEVGG